jgi:hypothetical protein
MAQILELAHLVEQHGMAQVKVGRGRVETGLDAQRAPSRRRASSSSLDDFVGAAADQRMASSTRTRTTPDSTCERCASVRHRLPG